MKKNFLKIALVAIACVALIGALVGCNYVAALLTDISSGEWGESDGLAISSTSRGTSLSLTGGELSISRAQLTEEAPMGEEGTRTVLIYMCGTDLESGKNSGLAVADLKELVAGAYNENVRIVIQTGGAKKWSNSSISARNITRFVVTESGLDQVEVLPQANMGAASTLADFLVWGVTNYPAEKTDVILWNHGSGSINGVCFDENYNNDSLSVQELDEAFLSVFSHMTDKFESIGFDACLMSSVEVANVCASYARYMIASEESEAGNGWQYKAIANALAQNPSMSGAELGKVVADSAYEALTRDVKKQYTMAVVDLSKIDDVCKAFDKAAEEMCDYVQDNPASDLVKLITQATNFGGNSRSEGYTNMVDLGDMMSKVSSLVPSAAEAAQAVSEAVVYKVDGSARASASGLSVYYPLKVQGSSEAKIFTAICVSPHYLAYLDQTVFGTSTSGSSSGSGTFGGNHSNNSWNNWLQNDFDFWSLLNGLTDYWNDIPDVTGGDSYNVIDQTQTDGTLQIVGTPYLDGNGTYTVQMNNDSLQYLVTVDYALFLKNEDGTKTLIGSDVDVTLTYGWTGAVMTDQFKGNWIALNDGQLIAAEVIEETETYAIYAAPILLNGSKATLRLKRDVTKATAEYEVLGVYGGVSVSGAATKSMTSIEEGDQLIPVYYVYHTDGTITETQGHALTIGENGLVISVVTLADGDYEYCFIMTDTAGATYYTEATLYTIKGNVIYYTSQKIDEQGQSYQGQGQGQQGYGQGGQQPNQGGYGHGGYGQGGQQGMPEQGEQEGFGQFEQGQPEQPQGEQLAPEQGEFGQLPPEMGDFGQGQGEFGQGQAGHGGYGQEMPEQGEQGHGGYGFSGQGQNAFGFYFFDLGGFGGFRWYVG